MTIITNKKELNFFHLYDQFILDSTRGKRLQPNGKRISTGTIKNYQYTKKILELFCLKTSFNLRITPIKYTNKTFLRTEGRYWNKFYKKFISFLYDDCGYFDNYVGLNVKNLKVFFNYLDSHLSVGIAGFHKKFYVRKEEVAIHTLLPEELSYLIYNKEFEASLSKRLKETKDMFVFGCTVALRISDLLLLKKSNIRVVNEQYYLSVRSKKTSSDSLIKLPEYAIEILNRYKKLKRGVLPHFNKSNLNLYIKQLFEKANFKQPISKLRSKRGVIINKRETVKNQFRFCDIASSHTMRRTAITTMLALGMPEQVVRRISGHSAGSKEFYRYVSIAQTYQDRESEKVYENLKQKTLIKN